MNNETEQIFILNAVPSQPSTSTQKLGEADMPGSSQDNPEDDEDLSHVCRTCASITEFVIPIFSGEGLQNNLADKIHKHLPIRVHKADVLPLVLCYQCASTLLAWHELVQCCVQADGALRARVRGIIQEATASNPKSNSGIEREALSKFTAFTEYLQLREPPQYQEPRTPPSRCCAYCGTTQELSKYQEHLIDAHSELLFHCEECNKCIDRKDLLTHMSRHAEQYTSVQDRQELKKRKLRKKNEVTGVNQNTSKLVTKRSETSVDQELNINEDNGNLKNEFSDHSDTDYGFGPLPESVFEAIEDSQDSQPLDEDTSHAPDNERLSDESNKSEQQSETRDLSTPAPSMTTSDIGIGTPSSMKTSNPTQDKNDLSDSDQTDDTLKKQQKKTRTCPICAKEYTASSSFFYHMKYIHKGIREHECEVCGRRFGTKDSWTSHMTIHTGHYEFECRHCKKLFKSKASLYIHEQIHSNKKLWSCNQCHTSFRWKTHLVRHMKRHAAEKGHVCSTCGRGFSIRCDLLRHVRTHSAGNFTCDKCGMKFAQQRYLKVHLTKQHSNK